MVHNHSIVGPMVHNHRKPSLPMVVLPQNHRKTIDPNGLPYPNLFNIEANIQQLTLLDHNYEAIDACLAFLCNVDIA